MSHRFIVAVMTAVVVTCTAQLSAQVGTDAEIEDRLIEITPETREAIDRGLKWLASQQKEDGSWEGGRGGNTGVASFAVLSFMSTGVVPERGPYGRTVAKGIDFVISHAQLNGLISNPVDSGHGPMYEHAMSTTMLAEAWGMYHRPKLLDTLQNAVVLILASQNDQGGWRYQPQPSDADISVTVMQVVALRAAKNAGLRVPKSTFDHATTYIKSCAKPNGGFLYQPATGEENYARTGAGVCSLLTCGDYDSEETINGITFLQDNKRKIGNEHYHYAMYYAAQAMYLAPDPEEWKQWWPVVRDEMLERQKEDGHWDGEAGPIYGTGMAILALSVPYRYLPVYQH